MNLGAISELGLFPNGVFLELNVCQSGTGEIVSVSNVLQWLGKDTSEGSHNTLECVNRHIQAGRVDLRFKDS